MGKSESMKDQAKEQQKAKRREYNKNNPDKVERWKVQAYINFLKSRGFMVTKNDQAAQ